MASANLQPGAMPVDPPDTDPFTMPSTPPHNSERQRYAAFDSNAFTLFSSGSPAQVKRALLAHKSELDRQLQDASNLGQKLLASRNELADQLKEVEGLHSEDEMSAAMKERLRDLEKEVNDVSRETARVFAGKNRVVSNEGAASESTEFGGVAHPSPSKAHAPSARKQRNQQPSRVTDLKLATDISTSLLEQVRVLQASLAEREEQLRMVNAEKSELESDLDLLRQRLRALEESEQRFKDETWRLETEMQALTANHQEATDREQRATQGLAIATSQKAALEAKFEDLRAAHAKLNDDHSSTRKQHESDMAELKKNATADETQITGLHKKVEELTSQNKELAQAFAYRLNDQSRSVSAESAMDGEQIDGEVETPENSPPGSPSKATPRHGALHSETTQSALNHAYRMIQNLKNQLHREKTEKIEYRRLLQDARDEIESKRGVADSGKKRKGKDAEVFKKPTRPDRLGGARESREDITMDDDWEDHDAADTPSKSRTLAAADAGASKRSSVIDTSTDAYATATEGSEAFETANERDGTVTESDAFQTGAETLDGDSDADLTETEAGPTSRRPPNDKRMSFQSFQSTASTSGDEDDSSMLKTPVQAAHPKYRIRVSRGGQRRVSGRPSSEALATASRDFEDSPRGSMDSNQSTPQTQGQSLFAELENLSDDESQEGTPASSKMLSPVTSPELRRSPAPSKLRESVGVAAVEKPKVEMVDTGVMTEPWEPEPAPISVPTLAQEPASEPESEAESKGALAAAVGAAGAAVAGGAGYLMGRDDSKRDSQASSVSENPLPTPTLQDFPSPPSSLASPTAHGEVSKMAMPSLSQSTVAGQDTEPVTRERPTLGPSMVFSQHTEPVEATPAVPVVPEAVKVPEMPPVKLSMSSFTRQSTEPVDAPAPRPSTATKVAEGAAAGAGVGFLGGLLGRNKKPVEEATIAEDETSQPPRTPDRGRESVSTGQRVPFRQIDGNAPPSPERKAIKSEGKAAPVVPAIETTNEATQTALSSEDLDRLLRPKPVVAEKPTASPTKPTMVFGSSSTAASPRRSKEALPIQDRNRRPSSAGSTKSRDRTPPPPLPMEAREAIAAAAAAAPGTKPSSSASNNVPPPAFGTMGPPTMPASAYRNSQQFRPKTPLQQTVSASASPVRGGGVGTISIARPGTANRSQLASPTTTRRSSVSSFASELDHRFNISSTGFGDGAFMDPNSTDPRMIQAITQTMIGEYMFKYTRNAGRETMSSTRHKRFFWVHPYTRTLYWSDQDPSTAGNKQLKAKSVQIEAVQVVSDDNPMPPGLHRKSLVVMTPGRTIKFTAPTSQRHETWSNALTYLLLKTGTEREDAGSEVNEEFNPRSGNRSSSRATGRSRASLSSYMSRGTTVRTQSPQRSTRDYPTLRAPSAQGHRSSSVAGRGSTMKRLSAIAGSFTSRHSKQSLAATDADEAERDAAYDSAEDLRRVIEQQERDADRLENVRACCDGKHDVGSLTGTMRGSRVPSHYHQHSHSHSHSNSYSVGRAGPSNDMRSLSRNSERR